MATHPLVPGEPTKTSTTMLETATAAVQKFGPINAIHQHLCAFHFYGNDMTRQVEAHHFCGHQNEEMRQCLIYDSPEADARLIGIEYIVSENLFMTLPDAEKRLWHSHEYEVDRGDNLPLGLPQIMMALTRDGQLYSHLASDVEKKYNVNFEKERENRAYMKGLEHGIHPLANAEGKGLRTELREVDCNGGAGAHSTPRVFV
uniref:Oil body-associated protein 1A n=1 Tax=Chenopodium quinoa TaxID=63459 RepID=A0A803LZK8_CHEQI